MTKVPYHQVVANQIIESLKQGTAPWLKPWEPGTSNGQIPFNPVTGKRYRGINAVSVRRNTPTKARHHRSCYELYRTRSMKYVKETRGLGEVIKGV